MPPAVSGYRHVYLEGMEEASILSMWPSVTSVCKVSATYKVTCRKGHTSPHPTPSIPVPGGYLDGPVSPTRKSWRSSHAPPPALPREHTWSFPEHPWSLLSPLSPPLLLEAPGSLSVLERLPGFAPCLPLTPAHLPQERVCSTSPVCRAQGSPVLCQGQRGCGRWSVRRAHTKSGVSRTDRLSPASLLRPRVLAGAPQACAAQSSAPWSPCLSCVSVSSLHACCGVCGLTLSLWSCSGLLCVSLLLSLALLGARRYPSGGRVALPPHLHAQATR